MKLMNLRTRIGRVKNALRNHPLARCSRGNTMMLFGLSLVPVVGVVGIALDGGQWMLWKRQLHTTADLAALAGANAIGDGHNVEASVRRSMLKNKSLLVRDEDVVIDRNPDSGPEMGNPNAIRVEMKYRRALPFSSMFVTTAPWIKVTAIAIVRNEVPNCVLALDTAETDALSVAGSATVVMNCGMATNSSGSEAADIAGDLVDVAAISAVGQIQITTAVDPDTAIHENMAPVDDPYMGRLAIPDLSTLCASPVAINVGTHSTQTISQGCYSGLSVSGELFLNPGTYYINDGDVDIGSQGRIKGEGVTLVFTNKNSGAGGTDFGRFRANGTSVVQLRAPTSGPYEGVVMYQDRRATPSNGTNFFVAGNSGTDNAGHAILSYLQGAVYTPGTYTTLSGNSSFDTDCMQLVSKRVEFTGNTEILNTCAPGSGAAAYGGTKIARLVH
ncbi:MAG: Tad domain-containing protein [Novosphingobium sp.]|nr:Tad domain-containing protein [Novosphingobium sp.]